MSEEVSIHQAPRLAARRRLPPRLWTGIGIAGILLLVCLGLVFVLGRVLSSNGPDAVQFVALTPPRSPGGRFSIQLRLRRADGTPMGTSMSTTADLIDVQTGKQLLGRQCGFSVQQAPAPGGVDVTLTDLSPASLKAPRRVRAQIQTRMLPPREVLAFLIWELSRRKLPQPRERPGGWRTFTHELDLPPAPSTSPTGRE